MTGRHRLERPEKHDKPLAVRAAVVTAPVLTAGAVGVGVLSSVAAAPSASSSDGVNLESSVGDAARQVADTSDRVRSEQITRSTDRVATAVKVSSAPQRQKLTRFTTDSLDVRVRPAAGAKTVEELEPGTKVTYTGVDEGQFSEIAYKGERRWVTGEYLSKKRPQLSAAEEGSSMGVSDGACPSGSDVESGLTDAAVKVHRAVCNNFPEISTYLGYDAHGEHSSGKAIDIMLSDQALGDRVAEFLKAHAAELDLYDVIYRQRIWTPVRASEGWRSMPDRGSATANHYDHVHVSVN
ncbi:hypothetical protein GCM10011519_01910 [Marmoricola endophyticus]|uniref:SH3b domain-containing protein n=1 Tax=Marmoricola endophyticus TaxID=2040280 RepID=A0A917BA08_9ACTN|nr:SH3 domain-containing protein [Marmoricola endophyticus]GGF32116.1 hypothetical protein GCM10011519_01910 [Marmoricola endophyticus]